MEKVCRDTNIVQFRVNRNKRNDLLRICRDTNIVQFRDNSKCYD